MRKVSGGPQGIRALKRQIRQRRAVRRKLARIIPLQEARQRDDHTVVHSLQCAADRTQRARSLLRVVRQHGSTDCGETRARRRDREEQREREERREGRGRHPRVGVDDGFVVCRWQMHQLPTASEHRRQPLTVEARIAFPIAHSAAKTRTVPRTSRHPHAPLPLSNRLHCIRQQHPAPQHHPHMPSLMGLLVSSVLPVLC